MRFLIGLLTGLLGSSILIWLNIKLMKYVLSLVPTTSNWAGLIKVLLVFADIWLVGGIVALPIIVGIVFGTYLENKR